MAKQTRQERAIMASLKNGQRVKFTKENVKRVPTKSGYYEFYRNGKLVYIGVGNNLKHRVESYQEKDDFDNIDGHPSKKRLRNILDNNNDVTFQIHQVKMSIARKQEEILKQHAMLNMDNKANEKKKHEAS